MFDINLYHWVWYLIGFVIEPKLTVMICISLHFKNHIPTPLFVFGWVIAVLSFFSINGKSK